MSRHQISAESKVSRRRFLATTAAGATASLSASSFVAQALAAPAIHTQQKSGSSIILGEGDHRYEVQHDWVTLPEPYSWQTTHNVAVDQDGMVYVIHEGRAELADHPTIFVFDPDGKYVRSFGSQYQGGGHGLEVRQEGSDRFLYITGYQHLKLFAKLDTQGEVVWEKRAPMESGKYAEGEAANPQRVWGRDRFMPTNYAFHPSDGGYYVADGYGSYTIQRYDKDGAWQQTIGEPGQADGQFNLPHGVWIDLRGDGESTLVVADRVNARLQWFTLDGDHIRTQDGFILPANVDTYEDLMLVPDLSARVTLLGADNSVIAHLGEDPAWREEVLKDQMKLRREPKRWQAGKFIHPHDACFDNDGNILVAEWVATGRITKLRRV